jgi:phosphate starvation-inducible PhoH-like protein
MRPTKRKLSQSEIYNELHPIDKHHTPAFSLETFKLAEVLPKTYPQGQAIEAFLRGSNLFMGGSAGTGKSYLGMYLALKWMLEKTERKVLVIRSAVQTRDIGFTPGTQQEKEALYSVVYKDMTNSMFHSKQAWTELEKNYKVDFMSTSFLRGTTFNNTCILFDEIQDTNLQEAMAVATRLGKGSRIIFCGDQKQTDLIKKNDVSGFADISKILDRCPSVEVIKFMPQDIVRSGFVKEFLLAAESLGL